MLWTLEWSTIVLQLGTWNAHVRQSPKQIVCVSTSDDIVDLKIGNLNNGL
jgi:hypothetical protein